MRNFSFSTLLSIWWYRLNHKHDFSIRQVRVLVPPLEAHYEMRICVCGATKTIRDWHTGETK